MIAQIVSIATVVIIINGGAIGLLWRQMNKNKEEVEEQIKELQTKETCVEVVKRIDQRAEDRHATITGTLERIESLIKKNGYSTPRVQT